MGITEKGKKGFQKVENKRNVRRSFHLTKEESDRLNKYLKQKNLTNSQFIRELIKDIIKD